MTKIILDMGNMSKKIYVECTQTYTNPNVRTGIQRVVRNIIKNTSAIDLPGYEVIPVAIKGTEFYEVPTLDIQNDQMIYQSKRKKVWDSVIPFFKKIYGILLKINRCFHISQKFNSIFGRDTSSRIKNSLKRITMSGKKLIFAEGIGPYPIGKKKQFNDGDVLILLDSSWIVVGDAVRSISNDVVKIGVMYDLVPILYKTYCDEGLVTVFNTWLADIKDQYDGFLCISNSVRDDLKRYLSSFGIEKSLVESFYLGSELDLDSKNSALDPGVLLSGFDSTKKNFLVVGTLEPRKNVDFILDAFDQFFNRNPSSDVVLWLVGKVGWKVEALKKRIQLHPLLGKNLFHLGNATDAELNFLYCNSACLIQASKAEGFGLPVVEALQKGLPVLASDIPVFRELVQAVDSVKFFSLDNVNQLSEMISQPLPLKPSNFKWLTWPEATQEFYLKAVKMIDELSN